MNPMSGYYVDKSKINMVILTTTGVIIAATLHRLYSNYRLVSEPLKEAK